MRGSLPAIQALKGTLFTVGSFSVKAQEAAKAAPPISLVNGEELIDLLVEHRLGITVTSVELVTDVDESVFSPNADAAGKAGRPAHDPYTHLVR